MAKYQVLCVDQEPWDQNNKHAQIVALGTRAADGSTRRWSAQEVIRAIEKAKKNKKKKKKGDAFFTVDPKTGAEAKVRVRRCKKCGHKIIKSSPDATSNNNLNSLKRC